MKNSGQGEAKQNSSESTVDSLDKAFEWLVLVQTVLIGIIFQVLTWIAKPGIDYRAVAQFMFSLTTPLITSIITWFTQLITSKISFRSFSWGILTMVFFYYVMVFCVLISLGITTKFLTMFTVSFIAIVLAVVFPSKRILSVYRTTAAGNKFLKTRANTIWYIAGIIVAWILILLPFTF